jgi:hypothetical protein
MHFHNTQLHDQHFLAMNKPEYKKYKVVLSALVKLVNLASALKTLMRV